MLFHQASLLSFPRQYLDPGTGSLLVQLLLAALLGIGVTTKLYWQKIKSRFNGGKPETTVSDEDDDLDK